MAPPLHLDDTIAAIATPPGVGAVAVIRVSGENTFRAADKIFEGKKRPSDCPSHTIHYGAIVASDGSRVDDVLLSIFRAPHSYTGQDVIEISTHGNPLIAAKILELLTANGARLAEPGEFTKRAFLNNRIDLTQAEAVLDVITARTDASLKGARNQLDGLLAAEVKYLREKMIQTASLLELELDFAEEEVEFVDRAAMIEQIAGITARLDELIATYSFGRVIRDGVNAAIVGTPNVGKSSLLNYLLKESRAIVSATPGTTRDIIREELSVDGILFRLFDTAGIRATEDSIEKEGVLRSRRAVENADLVLFISDTEQPFARELFDEVLSLVPRGKIIHAVNKSDLGNWTGYAADIHISALTGAGITELLSIMKVRAFGGAVYTEKTAVVSSLRHFTSLKLSREALLQGLGAIDENRSSEYIAAHIRAATQALSEIIGEVTDDDILNNIFSKFCIGK